MKAPLILYLSMLACWQYLPTLLGVPAYVFPTLGVVVGEFWRSGDLIIANTYTTLIEALLGVALGCSIGLVVGLAMASSKSIERSLLPLVVGSNAVPVVAVAPLFVLWFGYGMTSKVVVAAFLSFFPVALSAFDGLRIKNDLASDMFKVMGATPLQYFVKYRLPKAVPSILTGLKISAVLAVIGAVVSEFIGSDSGLGFGMLQARYNLNTPRLFCYTIASCALGLSIYQLFSLLERFVRSRKRWIRV